MHKNYLTSPSPHIYGSFNPPLNISVMASGNGSNFEAIIDAINHKKLQANISCLIVNNHSCYARTRAENHNINCVIHDHRDYSSREDLDDAIIRTFKTFGTEIVVMAGWMRIVSHKLIKEFPNRIINIHPSLLPSFKGKDAINQALDANVKITGCSAHIVTEQLDSGKLIIQSAVPILDIDNKESLSNKIKLQEHIILPNAISIIGESIRGSKN